MGRLATELGAKGFDERREKMSGEGGRKEVAFLAWPLAIGMLSFTVMGVTDTILMGQVSTPAQAGVGLATTLVFAVTAFFRTEESDKDSGIKEAPWPCVVPLALTAIGCFALFFLAGPLLRLAGIGE